MEMVMELVLTALAAVLLSLLAARLVSALGVRRDDVLEEEEKTSVLVDARKLESRGGGRMRSERRVTFAGVEEREVDRFEDEPVEEDDLDAVVYGGYGAEIWEGVEGGEGFEISGPEISEEGVEEIEEVGGVEIVEEENVVFGAGNVKDTSVEVEEEIGGLTEEESKQGFEVEVDTLVYKENIERLGSEQDGGIGGGVGEEEKNQEVDNGVLHNDEAVDELVDVNAVSDEAGKMAAASADSEHIIEVEDGINRELRVTIDENSDGSGGGDKENELKDEPVEGTEEAEKEETYHGQILEGECDDEEENQDLQVAQIEAKQERLGSNDEDDWEGIERSQLEKDFAAATAFFSGEDRDGKLLSIGSDVKMQLHGLQKIAMEGPCREAQPMALKMSARAKWNAWQRLGNMNPDEAMEQYIAVVSDTIPGWGKQNSVAEDQLRVLEAIEPSTPDHGLGVTPPSKPPKESQRMKGLNQEAEHGGTVESSSIEPQDNK